MTPIERQILKNQRDMMVWNSKGKYYEGYFSKRIKETEELIEPSKGEEPCCEMPERKGYALVGGQVGEAAKIINKFAKSKRGEKK